jgi:hypothetical protein
LLRRVGIEKSPKEVKCVVREHQIYRFLVLCSSDLSVLGLGKVKRKGRSLNVRKLWDFEVSKWIHMNT